MRLAKILEYSDKGLTKTKTQRKIVKEIVENEIEEEENWEQIENTLEDLFQNIENYDGYNSVGQKKIDTRMLEKHMRI